MPVATKLITYVPFLLATSLLPVPAALAQSLNAQNFQPAMDSPNFLAVDSAQVGFNGPGGGVLFNLASEPLVYTSATGVETNIVDNLGTIDALLYYNLAFFRIGVDAPLHVVAIGEGIETAELLGDVGIDAKFRLIDRASRPIGLTASLRMNLPTGSTDTWTTDGVITYRATAALAGGRKVIGALNLGFDSGAGGADIHGLTWGPHATWAGGLSVPLMKPIRLSAEVLGEYAFNNAGQPGAMPHEALFSFRANPVDQLRASLGVGLPLFSSGVGTPDFRIITGFTWTPDRVRSTPTPPDLDQDTIPDARDRCPDQAEDQNGINDEDGCPDGDLTPTYLKIFRSGTQELVPHAKIRLLSGPVEGQWDSGEGIWVRSLPPGTYQISVSADGYGTITPTLTINAGVHHEDELSLVPKMGPAIINVQVLDSKSRPVPRPILTVEGLDDFSVTGDDSGRIEASLPAGEHTLRVDGPPPERERAAEPFQLPPGMNQLPPIILHPRSARLETDRIVLYDKVFFESGSDVILPESFGLLNDVVDILWQNNSIRKIEIQGHTDDRGTAEDNLRLSSKRAEAVQFYLYNHGIEAARMTARGYGEDEPLVEGNSEDARAQNRRVEFKVVEYQKEAQEKAPQ